MSKQLIINCTSFETRVALIERSQLVEYYIERRNERGIVGSIFKGKIARVLPGMQSAFVDIGLDRAAFLYVGDIHSGKDASELPDFLEEEDKSKKDDDENHKPNRHQRITDLVKEGQEILVQVAKDSIGTKGARVTTYLSLPGRYVVLMPNIDHIGVSRKIESEDERARLRTIVNQCKPEGVGVIVRTASENVPEEKIVADIEFLAKLWENIRTTQLKSKAPSLVHEDLNLIFRCTRDLLAKEFERIVIDDRNEYENLVRFLNRFSVRLGAQVQLYQGDVSIFDAYGVELEVARAIDAKVWLKSGGYLVIEQTEALTAIDVNTGRFVGGKNLGDTIVKTNFEAVKEIVLQLRLRNIGGIIILDLIDMDRQDDRDRVFEALLEELKKDRAKTSALRISDLGLIQMTRKRTEESLAKKLCMPCPYCDGTGMVKSTATVAYQIIRDLVREFAKSRSQTFIVKASPMVADRLLEEDKEFVDELREHYDRQIVVTTMPEFHVTKFEITSE